MSSPSVRRSARQRKPNTKYSTDALDKEVWRLLRASSESSHHVSPETSDSEDTRTDNKLDILIGAVQANVTSSVLRDHNNISITSGSARGSSHAAESLTPSRGRNHTLSMETPVLDASSLLPEIDQGTREHFSTLFGARDEDILPLLHVRDRWLGAEDATFPSRKTLTKSIAEGIYGRTVTGGVVPEKLKEEASWDWYYDEDKGGRFRERQRVEEVSKEMAQDRYLPKLSGKGHEVVMGPWDRQDIFLIGDMCAVDFGEAWEVHKKTKPQLNPAEADANAMAIEISPQVADAGAIAISSTDTSSNKERYHEGFLLNLGQKVQCLAWAPSDANSSFQYLAVSCAHTSTQSSSGTLPATLASSLGPSPPIPSSIQIWAFKSTGHAPHIPAKLDVTTKPKLVQVLCTDWGYIRQILWCPVPREIRTSINDNEPLSREEWLGLLGIVTSDGFAAVLDVTIPLPTPDVEAQYLHVSSPAFAVSPPSPAICTGLAFASTSDFIIATCTGAVSIYNVTDSTALGATEPRLSYQLENTDVCAISNAYPSPHPTILASASASGSLSLTDLYRPSQENASANKPCDPPLHLTYSPLAQTFITTSGGDVKLPSILTCHSMQHFTIGTNITRVPSERPVTALASSKWHPGILFGTADGSVFSTNYLRRLIPQAQVTDSSGAFIQKLCEYEWIVTEPTANFSQMDFNRQPPEQLGGGRSSSIAKTALPTHQERGSNVAECLHIEASVPSAGDTRPGRSRFHEGFQAERVDITQPMPGKKGQNPITETVFQEEQGVAAVDWNPNLSCAGWLAVAWGSGLVRVQDVARGT